MGVDRNRFHYVIWSGGLDSTMLLHELAKQSSEDREVYAISISHTHINKDKEKMESKARSTYMKFAKRKGYHLTHFHIDIDSEAHMYNSGANQACIWLFHALPYIWNYSTVHFGYVSGDEFWHHRNHFVSMFKDLISLRGEMDVCYSFDYEWTKKYQLLDKAKNQLPDGAFWYCEFPKKKGRRFVPCGKCGCCKRHAMAEYALSLEENEKKFK